MSYRLFPSTNGPGSSISYGGSIVTGALFEVTASGMVLQGYWFWRADSGQSASASFALWKATGFGTGTLVASSSASTSTMVVGQWNYVPLPSPLALTPNTAYKAVVGMSGNFPDTSNQFGTGGPYVGGITNGPLTAFSTYASGGGTLQDAYGDIQCTYDLSTSDPTAVYPATDSSAFNAWIDVQVSFTAVPDIPQVQPGPAWLRLFKPGLARPVPAPPALQAVNASGGLTLASLAMAGQGAQTSPDIPSITPGPAWFRWFKPQWPKPVPPAPATRSVNAAGGVALAPLAMAATGGQTSPDIPQTEPGPFWLRLFKPWILRPVPPIPAIPAVSATGSLTLAPLTLAAAGAQTSPDIQQAQPGPFWFRLFKPWVQRPVPPIPATPSVNITGGLSLAPLVLSATGAQTSSDVPQVQPGPAWLRLFKPALYKPVPPVAATPAVNATGGLVLAPLAFAATGAQTSLDIPQITPGPAWLRLFKPWVQRPVPPIPAPPAVNATGSFALAPLAFTATGGQTSPDVPQVQPGPFWLRIFKPGLYKPGPPPPALQAVNATGGLALAPVALTATAAQTSPDVPQAQPGPAWFRLFKPWIQRPVPPIPGPPLIAGSGGLSLAPLAMTAYCGQTSPDQPQITPGPAWLRFFKPWVQRPVPPPPSAAVSNAAGGVALAPLAMAATGGQTSPDVPVIQPGPAWLRLFKPWVQRPAPVPPVTQSVNATGSLALAPLGLSGQGAQTSPDARQVQPGPVWMRLFRPWLAPKVPPLPAAPAVNATGGLALAPLALSGTATVTGSPNSDQPQLQPGPVWLRLFKPWVQRPAPATAGQGPATIATSGGLALAPLAMSGAASTPSPLFAATGARWKWGTAGSQWKWSARGARNQ